MNFRAIFTEETECKLWAVCYPEDRINDEERDIFTILFDDKWVDISYIRDFLKTHETELNSVF